MIGRTAIGVSARALALASLLLAIVAPASAQVHVVMPDCRPSHLDVPRLAELLIVELSGEVTVEIDPGICDADAANVTATVRTARGSERVHLPIVGDDPAGRARALALVIAERAHLSALEASAPEDVGAPERVADDAATEVPSTSDAPEASSTGEATDDALVVIPNAPRGVFIVDRDEPSRAPRPSIALPPSIEVVVLGRVAPIVPITLAVGVRAEVNAHIDRFWSLGLGVTTTWSHQELLGDAPHVVIGALSGSVAWTPYREHGFDMVLRTRGAIGAGFVGGQGVSETAVLWATLGGDATLLLWPTPSLAVVLEMGVSGVLAGTSVFGGFGDLILRLRDLLVDASVGFRVPLE